MASSGVERNMFFEDREFDFLSRPGVFHGVAYILHAIGAGRSEVHAMGIAADYVRSIAMNEAHRSGGSFYLRNTKRMDGFMNECLTPAGPPDNGDGQDKK